MVQLCMQIVEAQISAEFSQNYFLLDLSCSVSTCRAKDGQLGIIQFTLASFHFIVHYTALQKLMCRFCEVVIIYPMNNGIVSSIIIMFVIIDWISNFLLIILIYITFHSNGEKVEYHILSFPPQQFCYECTWISIKYFCLLLLYCVCSFCQPLMSYSQKGVMTI